MLRTGQAGTPSLCFSLVQTNAHAFTIWARGATYGLSTKRRHCTGMKDITYTTTFMLFVRPCCLWRQTCTTAGSWADRRGGQAEGKNTAGRQWLPICLLRLPVVPSWRAASLPLSHACHVTWAVTGENSWGQLEGREQEGTRSDRENKAWQAWWHASSLTGHFRALSLCHPYVSIPIHPSPPLLLLLLSPPSSPLHPSHITPTLFQKHIFKHFFRKTPNLNTLLISS